LAAVASAADETPEGKSIVELYRRMPGVNPVSAEPPAGATFVPFSAQTRMSGIDVPHGPVIRKGAIDAIGRHVKALGGQLPPGVLDHVNAAASEGAKLL